MKDDNITRKDVSAESVETKLKHLKRELKCWESMFFRSHGRKPGKSDIDESGNEIRDAYKEYFHLRSRLNETPDKEDCPTSKNENKVETIGTKEKLTENGHSNDSSNGVFGTDLNKNRQEKETSSSHLKERNIVRKSFIKKRHLRIPFENKNESENENKEKTSKEEKSQELLPTSSPQSNCDINEEDLLKEVKIVSNDENKQSPLPRKCIKIPAMKTNALSRNYKVSTSWLEKYNPKTEEISTETNTPSSLTELQSSPMARHEEKDSKLMETKESFEVVDRKVDNVMNKNDSTRAESPQMQDIFEKTEFVKQKIGDENYGEEPLTLTDDNVIKSEKSKGLSNVVINREKQVALVARKQSTVTTEKDQIRKSDNFEFDDDNDNKISENHVNSNLSSAANESSSFKKTVQRKRKKTEICDENIPGDNDDGRTESSQDCTAGQKATKKRKVDTGNSAGEVKIPRGKRLVSENFVRIDITKKKFCRGKRRIKASTYKRQQWKKKTQFNSSTYSSSKATAKCFKCGQEGHWAKECAKKSIRGNPDRGSSFNGKKNEDYRPVHESDADQSCATFSLEDVPDLPRSWPRIPYQPTFSCSPVEPLFAPANGKPSEEAFSEVNKALRSLGYSSFRHGQEATVARIVSGLSTLLVLSTGSGKSLCYQLPAYLYYKKAKYLTIVISPLVALMEDQVGNLPYGLKGACFHTNMTKAQRDKVMRDLNDNKIAILLLSPEALVAGSTATGHMPLLSGLPPIAFACIDEAHCVSEWSHNFRPNYLRVCKVLREELGVRCFLGLTATATKSTSMSITRHLRIEEEDSIGAIIRGAIMPDNLHLTVSRDEDRDRALVQLLSGPRFEKCISVIIYCTRREETERLSSMLRTCLKNLPPTELENDNEEEGVTKEKPKRKGAKSKKPKIMSVLWDAECYHAGMTPAQRRRVQKRFMSGELRIVVATTAFGMGLDKSDVRAIIHYNMPKSFESFLQEVGRAGRDGLPAHCHIFLDDEAKDLCELRRHTYSNSVDKKSVKRLVNKIFKSCDCKQRFLESNSSNVQLRHTDKVKIGSAFGESATLGKAAGENFVDDGLLDDLNPEDFEDINENFSQSGLKEIDREPMAVGEDYVSSGQSDDVKDSSEHSGEQGSSNNGQGSDACCSIAKQDNMLNGVYGSRDQATVDVTRTANRYCTGHHVGFSTEGAVQDLDMPEENIATLLSYLELHPDSIIKLMNPVKAMCTVKCYGGANQMEILAKKFMPMTAVFNNMKRNRMALSDSKCISFDIVEVADEMGWDLDIVYRELRAIQWNTQFSLNNADSSIGKSGIMVEFEDLSFHVISPGDLSDEELDGVCQILSDRIEDQEQMRILQLDALYNTLSRSSHDTYHAVLSNHDPTADRQLRENVGQYFECDPADMRTLLRTLSPQNIKIPVPDCKWDAISRDVRTMLGLHHDVSFNGRALARIFHGINSPCFPAVVWGRDRRFWRRYLDVDFNELRKFITGEIIKYRI